MNWESDIIKAQEDQTNSIRKSLGEDLEKAKSGIYVDTPYNRKKGLVGQKFGNRSIDPHYEIGQESKKDQENIKEFYSNKSRSKIVDDINNGKVVNDLFNEWSRVKTKEDHDSVMSKISKVRFGTYKQFNILDLIDSIGGGNTNKVSRNGFISEVKYYLDKNK